jgi:RNA polymerase sigma factor (TIGR02999 family)
MNSDDTSRITDLLGRARQGDAGAEGELFQAIYDDLRAIASRLMAQERKAHTLGPTDLVHNLYARLRDSIPSVTDQQHLFRLAAVAMGHLLTDHARRKKSRGGELNRVPLDEALDSFEEALGLDVRRNVRAEAVGDALDRLKKTHPRVYEVIHLRFFSNHTKAETARILGVSEGTVDNDWVVGRARLRLLLEENE